MSAEVMIKRLVDEGYSLRLIARQCKIPYMDLYRSLHQGRPLREEESVKIKKFAIVQPCME